MFKHRDIVRVVEGFYEGATGQVVQEFEYSGTDVSKVDTKDYEIKVTSYITVNEQDLELLVETKEKKGKK